MLNYLKIKNLALIANAEVEFAPGFNVITGETGAGKSIFLNTVALLTGERADKSLIRNGAERCELTAAVTIDAERHRAIVAALTEAGIELDAEAPEIQLRRVITRTQNRNFINDTPVAVTTLKAIGSALIDVHGPADSQSLWSRTRQLELLDRYGKNHALQEQCADAFRRRAEWIAEREARLGRLPSPAEVATLTELTAEIAAVDPLTGEDESLGAQHKLAANRHEILQCITAARALLTGDGNGLTDQLSGLYRQLEQLTRFDSEGAATLLKSCELQREAFAELDDALERYAANVELDEAAFAELENRLSAIYTLKRRYGPTLDAVLNRRSEAEERLALARDFNAVKAEYAQRLAAADARLQECAATLSAARRQAAEQFAAAVRGKLGKLGFPYCAFSIAFAAHDPGANGGDQIDMLFSANPGAPAAPLRQVASSGELARVMLAIKAVIADLDTVPVLIFDEIDVNIGGETAVAVGTELRQLARSRQCLCISHLPQVAALGETHFAVAKTVADGVTTSRIERLDGTARLTEIARMLGGTAAARVHAAELLAPPRR